MPIPPDMAANRRTITIASAAVAAVAVVGALAFSLLSVGNDCGNGFSAFRKPLPEELLSPDELAVIRRDKLSLYEARVAKAKPTEDCHRAGATRLIASGLGASLLLFPVAGVMGYFYLPRREDEDSGGYLRYDEPAEPRARSTRPTEQPTRPTQPARSTQSTPPTEDDEEPAAPSSLMSNWHNQPPR